MKKGVLLWVMFLLLTGCSLSESTSEENDNQNDDDEADIVYDELDPGELVLLTDAFDLVQANGETASQVVITSESNVLTMGNYGGLKTDTIGLFQIDLDDFYVFYQVKANDLTIHDMGLLREKNEQIVEYTSGRDDFVKETVVSNDATPESILTTLTDYGLVEITNYDYLGNVEQQSPYVYTAQVAFHRVDEFLGQDFKNSFDDFGGVDYKLLRIDVTYTFDEDYKGYDMDISFEISGEYEGSNVRVTVDMVQHFNYQTFEKQSVTDLGFNIPVSESRDDISYNGPIHRAMNFTVYPDQDNWVRYYLEPGYYRTAISAYELEDMAIYNEDMENVYSDYPFQVEEAGYYYVNLKTPNKTTQNFFIIDLGLDDISTETITGLEPGTLTGYSEGEKDYNKVIFPSVGEEYIVLIEVILENSLIHPNDVYISPNTVRDYSSRYCDLALPMQCAFLLDTDEDLELMIRTDDDLTSHYTLNYSFVKVEPTAQDMSDIGLLKDINDYDKEHPLQLGRGIANAYVLVTIEEDGKYSIRHGCTYGMCSNIDYDFYTLDGTLVELEKINGDNIEAGTYIVHLYYTSREKFDVIYPTLYKWD